MIILRTGLPGASKSLNSLRELVKEHDSSRPYYYTNIKILMLDMEVAKSFEGWFYGWFFPRLKDKTLKTRLIKIMKPVHDEGEFLSKDHVPFLAAQYDSHDHFETWLYWVRRVYKKEALEPMENVLSASEDFQCDKFEMVERFNLHFRRFEDAHKWFELPKSSVILIDECQQFFPPRPVGSKKPEYIGKFETHRHDGHDVHLITQHGTLIDANIRKLVNKHVEFYNPFGGGQVTRYEARKYSDFNDYHQKKQAKKSPINRDKDFYGLYWSAEIHTHKFEFPRMLLLLPFFLGVLGLSCWYLYETYKTLYPDSEVAEVEPAALHTPTELDESSSSPSTQIVNLVSKYTTNVFISGSVYVRRNTGESYYVYSFYDADTDELFYPNNMGLTVIAKSQCLAILKLEDVQKPVICNPNYNPNTHVQEQETLDRGDEIKGRETQIL
ncbi:zonular occludens toxin domain-containing protein [Vibrio nigripulchritudo]|uniref:zonular occludens toxin domain-containing protein n=1 Tax=Vibrio nigripulchritudo TaxID=28173 RepID=UPI0003B1A117|nr:zonular occludens toxin domain-containing protein [Vibrio nigripulchritudo]CCO41386.1 hypothetical protein VIBNISFn135_460002 [Vibrio nigripulchritudo SFn135]